MGGRMFVNFLAEEETQELLKLKNEIAKSLDKNILLEFEQLEEHIQQQMKLSNQLSNKIKIQESLLKNEVLKKGNKSLSLQKLDKIFDNHKTTFGNIDKNVINPIKNHFKRELNTFVDKEINDLKLTNNKLMLELSVKEVDYAKIEELASENKSLLKEITLYKSFIESMNNIKIKFIEYKNKLQQLTHSKVKDKALAAIDKISNIFEDKEIKKIVQSSKKNYNKSSEDKKKKNNKPSSTISRTPHR